MVVNRKTVSPLTVTALLIFADVIDSSIYSSTWGVVKYAKKLIEFQELFIKLGEIYFPKIEPQIVKFYEVKSRGDEGTIFCVDLDRSYEDLVYDAVKFSFELKARVNLLNNLEKENNKIPKRMDIGIGIHLGEVAVIQKQEIIEGKKRSIFEGIEGFSINYAKRIESCSRIGKYSNIFLSKEAAEKIEGNPIILREYSSSLKGIEKDEDVYEIQSAFFDSIPHNKIISESENFFNFYTNKIKKLNLLREPWLKGFIISLLYFKATSAKLPDLRKKYMDKIAEIAWKKPYEEDPILLFYRARECLEKKELTQSLKNLRDIVRKYPEFIHAHKKMVEVCWKIIKTTKKSAELVYIEDTVKEYLSKFPNYLSDEERKNFEGILKELKGKDHVK